MRNVKVTLVQHRSQK